MEEALRWECGGEQGEQEGTAGRDGQGPLTWAAVGRAGMGVAISVWS